MQYVGELSELEKTLSTISTNSGLRLSKKGEKIFLFPSSCMTKHILAAAQESKEDFLFCELNQNSTDLFNKSFDVSHPQCLRSSWPSSFKTHPRVVWFQTLTRECSGSVTRSVSLLSQHNVVVFEWVGSPSQNTFRRRTQIVSWYALHAKCQRHAALLRNQRSSERESLLPWEALQHVRTAKKRGERKERGEKVEKRGNKIIKRTAQSRGKQLCETLHNVWGRIRDFEVAKFFCQDSGALIKFGSDDVKKIN